MVIVLNRRGMPQSRARVGRTVGLPWLAYRVYGWWASRRTDSPEYVQHSKSLVTATARLISSMIVIVLDKVRVIAFAMTRAMYEHIQGALVCMSTS